MERCLLYFLEEKAVTEPGWLLSEEHIDRYRIPDKIWQKVVEK